MWKNILVPVFVFAVVSNSGLSAFAAQQAVEENKSDEAQMILAVIKRVDTVSHTITIETKEQRQGTFTVDSQTAITINGKKAAMAELKEGQRAKIAFNNQGKAISIDA